METVPSGPARIADVAALAGAGEGTVSRALHGGSNVPSATRTSVLDAIGTLDYRPSPVARILSLGRTMVIAVVLPWFTSPSAVARVRGVVEALSGSPYDLMVFDVEA